MNINDFMIFIAFCIFLTFGVPGVRRGEHQYPISRWESWGGSAGWAAGMGQRAGCVGGWVSGVSQRGGSAECINWVGQWDSGVDLPSGAAGSAGWITGAGQRGLPAGWDSGECQRSGLAECV